MRFADFAHSAPEAVAVIDGADNVTTRRELAALANAISGRLLREGLQQGQTVAVMMPNCAEYLAVVLAATQIGLYLVPINWQLSKEDLAYILNDCRASVFFSHARFRRAISEVIDGPGFIPRILVSIGASIEGVTTLDEFVERVDTSNLPARVGGRIMSYTSATTGRPKGVALPMSSAEAALDRSIQARIASGVEPEVHTHLCASMLFHGAPLETTIVALHMGHRVILMDTVAPENILRLIATHKVTNAYMPPAAFKGLLSLPSDVRCGYSTASLRRVVHTGAACPPQIKRQMIEWWGPILIEFYGSTEGSGTVVSSEEWLQRPGTVGRPLPGTRLLILDEQRKEVLPRTPGFVYLTRFDGDRFSYFGDTVKTDAAYLGDYFCVGDIGWLDEEGYLYLCDRTTEIVNSGGQNLYPAEVECALIPHPYVRDCATFGIPDDKLGERLVALVTLQYGIPPGRETAFALYKHLLGHLSPRKMPSEIEFVDTLPRDETGKLRRRELRKLYPHPQPAQHR